MTRDEAGEKERASKIVGPLETENNCASCHTLEAEAWQQSRHFTGFNDRHRSERAREILKHMGQRSMKRGTMTNSCRQCHYTGSLERGRIKPTSGVSCESCHEPAKDWIEVHHRVGGSLDAVAIDWGTGKTSDPSQREARLVAARNKGMVHSGMFYDIASNCLSCHAVPNETLVNMGHHKAGSDFDLVAWSQGEVRHNFARSHGAPDTPNNQASLPEQLRRMYVIGILVDTEYTLRNLASATEIDGEFYGAMIVRLEQLCKKLEAVAVAASLSEITAILEQIPQPVESPQSIDSALIQSVQETTQRFEVTYDGTTLDAIDPLIPTDTQGAVYQSSVQQH